MMSQQQNLSSVSQSLLQQAIPGANVKPFSIRQYVDASRHRNILHNWPFLEKHLQLCFKHGLIKEVLPPLKGCSNNLMHSPNDNDNNKEDDSCKAEVAVPQSTNNDCAYKVVTNHPSSHEEANYSNQRNCSISEYNLSQPAADTCSLPSSTLLAASKAVKDNNKRRRRHRGRCKKRSMVDILALARHSTLEEIHRMNKFYYAETTVIKGFV